MCPGQAAETFDLVDCFGNSAWTVNRLCLSLLGLMCAALMVCPTRAGTGERPEPSKPTSHSIRHIEGWTVRVDDRLLAEPNRQVGERALNLLQAKLADILYVMPENRLAALRQVTIVLDLCHGNLHAMQYHPSADWLAEHGYSTNLARCVHICEAPDFAASRQVNEQPWAVLHELAHAYHDQVLGFDAPEIREAYENFKRSGHGDHTLLFNGERVRHYALTDQKEFFAEMTESYFGVNDFFPFNRAELMTAEPEIYALMRRVWGPPKSGRLVPASEPVPASN